MFVHLSLIHIYHPPPPHKVAHDKGSENGWRCHVAMIRAIEFTVLAAGGDVWQYVGHLPTCDFFNKPDVALAGGVDARCATHDALKIDFGLLITRPETLVKL